MAVRASPVAAGHIQDATVFHCDLPSLSTSCSANFESFRPHTMAIENANVTVPVQHHTCINDLPPTQAAQSPNDIPQTARLNVKPKIRVDIDQDALNLLSDMEASNQLGNFRAMKDHTYMTCNASGIGDLVAEPLLMYSLFAVRHFRPVQDSPPKWTIEPMNFESAKSTINIIIKKLAPSITTSPSVSSSEETIQAEDRLQYFREVGMSYRDNYRTYLQCPGDSNLEIVGIFLLNIFTFAVSVTAETMATEHAIGTAVELMHRRTDALYECLRARLFSIFAVEAGDRQCKPRSAKEGNGETCMVCLMESDDTEKGMTLSCGHVGHPNCLLEWLLNSGTCPACRSAVAIDKALAEVDFDEQEKVTFKVMFGWAANAVLNTWYTMDREESERSVLEDGEIVEDGDIEEDDSIAGDRGIESAGAG